MAFEREFLDMFPQTVTWEPFSSYSTDGYGTRTFSTGRSVRARVQQKRTTVRDQQGRETVSNTRVFLSPFVSGTTTAVTIGPFDRLTLPAGFLSVGSSAPPIITVDRSQDDVGDHHFAVYL